MNYVIDTDILIYFLKNNKNVVEKFSEVNDGNIFTTIINYSELLFGAYNSALVEKNLKRFKSFLKTINVLKFDKDAAEHFAREKARLKKAGNLIDDMDLMIAGICLANEFTLVTNNNRHFKRIEALTLENWS